MSSETLPITRAGWFTRVVEVAIWGIGLGLVGYLALSVFGLVAHGSVFYVNFAMAIVAMSGLLALSEIDSPSEIEGEAGRRVRNPHLHRIGVLIAMFCGLGGLGYFWWYLDWMVINAPFFDPLTVTFGYLIMGGVIYLTWFHWGLLLASLCAGSILYFFFGQYIPISLLQHPGYSAAFIMNYVSLNTNQGFFLFSGVAADQIFLLVIFGTTLLGTGMLRLTIEIGKATGRTVRGGAALPAIIASGAIGAVMGQAVSNVVLSGRFTIPMMKRHGFGPAMAGAIEAAASSAGQILPPVLGLGGFLIAAFLGIPYVEVAMAALIPGLLYLTGVVFSVGNYALDRDLPRLNEPVDRRLIWRMSPTFLVSFVLVIWLLLGFRSAGYAALAGIVMALVLSQLQGPFKPTKAELVASVREGLVLTTLLSLLILAIGPLGQVMTSTNLSGRLATILATTLPDNEILLLIGAMVLSLVLGMGLPTPIAYVVASLAVVPFLQEVGVDPLRAHFFVFYFAVFSTLSPPVAVSVLAAAKLANASFWTTAVRSLQIASTTFIIPFAIVFNKPLLEFPNVDATVIMPIVEVLVTQMAGAIAAFGFCFKRLGWMGRGYFYLVVAIGYVTLTQHGRPVLLDILLCGSMILGFMGCYIATRAAARTESAP
ncbi:TRAP transporter permease [Roseovarius sp. 217]|uniref:TRAP transporter permease n=1 Tax=Roseovarius sp. (strain 217) TaxID=314264 RepID=UPI0000685B19|nr:TRAP transporter fused permease subunit [Roseovarius sp. 217]EAQ26847.1 TRAP-T family transporter, fused inner membrane subunits [Roseovarius sp. 217]